jgi:hypothetical protein
MAIESFTVGSKVRCGVTFRNDSKAVDDPTTVVFRVEPPTADAYHLTFGVDSAVVREGQGLYHIDLIVAEAGDWHWSVEGTGNVEALKEAVFVGRTRRIAETV